MLVSALAASSLGAADIPQPAQPSCDRVMEHIANGQFSRAAAELQGIPTAGRSEADQANLRGLAQMLNGDTPAAIDSFEIALALQPDMMEARFNRAVAFLRAGRYDRASQEFERIAADSASPFRASAAYHEALALDALGRAAEARAWADRARALDPRLDDALLLSGVLAERAGDLAVAGARYKSYLDRHPASTVALLRFGISAQRAGFASTAKKYLQQVIQLAPESPEAVEARKILVMWE